MRFVCVVIALLFSVSALGAQAPAKPEAAKAPVLDESDALAIQVVTIAGQLADSHCQGLEAVKAYRSLHQQAIARFEKKYPAYTVDFLKGALVAKGGK